MAADGTRRRWTVEHTRWLHVRPRTGHPVGIWTDDDGDALVLLPRRVS